MIRSKDATFKYAGAQSLKVDHSGSVGEYGVYQNNTVSAGTQYRLKARVTPPSVRPTSVKVEMIDGTAANAGAGTVLSNVELFSGIDWQAPDLVGTPTGTTLGIRFYAVNPLADYAANPFWIDDVSLIQSGSDVILKLREWNVGLGTDDVRIAKATIPYADIAVSPAISTHVLRISGLLRTDRSYGFTLQRRGSLSDAQYFELRYNTAGGYTGGALKYHNGSVWTDQGGDAYFVLRLPTSQSLYGIWSEVINSPNIHDQATAEQWGASVLAGRGAPIERASVRIIDLKGSRLEAVMPLPLMRVQGLTGNLLPERLSYSINEVGGIMVDLELGKLLPKVGDLLAWIEYRLARAEAAR